MCISRWSVPCLPGLHVVLPSSRNHARSLRESSVTPTLLPNAGDRMGHPYQERVMAKIAKTADRKKVMDTTKSTDCPKCGKPTRIVKRVKDRERDIPGGMYISCSACDFYEKL